MAFNFVLFITSGVFAALVFIGAIYFLVYFQHPDDKFVAFFPKIVVILGISLACYNIFLLPLDVANQDGSISASGGLPMETISFAFFLTTIAIGIVIVPFVMFYYEGVDDSDDEEDKTTIGGQIINGIKWTIPTLMILGVLDFLFWKYLSNVNVPFTEMNASMMDGDSLNGTFCNVTDQCKAEEKSDMIQVSPLISTVALATVVGWVLFAVFGGVGLTALPFDLLMDYKNRPQPIKNDVYLERKKAIGEHAATLLAAADELTGKQKELGKSKRSAFNRQSRKLQTKEKHFRNDVMELEQLYMINEESHKNAHGRALFFIFKAFIGLIGIILSFAWILHIILYLVPPIVNVKAISPFLNDFFVSVGSVPFLGVALYAMFTFWLLLCTIKGNTKLGLRILFMTIHPMKMGDTMMSSFIFNVGLILLSSLAVAQFSTMAFEEYARYTVSQTLFVATIRNLEKLSIFYDVMIFVLLIFSILSAIYCFYRPQAAVRKDIFKLPKSAAAGK